MRTCRRWRGSSRLCGSCSSSDLQQALGSSGVGACIAAILLAVPATGTSAPACSASGLRVSGGVQGASGSIAGPFYVTNVARTSCRLPSRPHMRIVAREGGVLPVRQVPSRLANAAPVRVLAPGRRAHTYLHWSNWCGPWPAGRGRLTRALRFRLTLRGGDALTLSVRTPPPRCDVPGSPSTLGASPFGRWT
jgi:Protein of unknown function (DUF4232)